MSEQVVIVTHLDYPSAEGMTYRVDRMASCLSSQYKVIVVAPMLERTNLPSSEKLKNYEILRIKIRMPFFMRKNRVLFRAYFLAIYSLLMIKAAASLSKEKTKLVQAEQQLSLLPALLLSQLLKATVIVDDALAFDDYYADYPRNLRVAFWAYEMLLFHRCHSIVCSSQNVAPSFQRNFNLPPSRIRVIPNGIELKEAYEPIDGPPRENKNVVFIGSMYSSQNLRAIMNLVNMIRNISKKLKNVRLFIIGGPTYLLGKGNTALIQSLGNVFLLGRVSEDEKRHYIGVADVCPLPFDPKDKLIGGVRLKSLECLASGKVVVSTSTGVEGISGVIHGKNVIIADDLNEFEQQLFNVLNFPGSYEHLKHHGIELAKKHEWDTVLAAYLPFVNDI